MHLYEKKLNSELIYDGKIIKVTKDIIELENGNTATREVVHHNGGVCIVPITDENEIIFVKQYRYPFEDTILEIPAGKIDLNEHHEVCGKRELREETGAEAEIFEYLGVMYPTTGYLTEKIYMYYAKNLTMKNQNLDDDEFLDVVKIPFEKALDMVMTGEIKDAKTQIAVLKTAKIFNIK